MDKSIKWLGGLLAAQLLFALLAFSGGTDLSAQRPDEPLITFEPAALTGIRIEGPDGESVSLAKSDSGWSMPDAANAPAKPSKVEQLLKRLHGLKKGLAMATTAGARTRFEVAEEKFQRRVTLLKDDEPLGDLYLGTSPGLRRIHARVGGDDPIYSAAFAAYEAPAQPDGWLDTELLRIAGSELEAIELDGLTLNRSKPVKDEEEGAGKPVWSAVGLAQGETLNQEKARELAGKITGLTVSKVLGTEAKPEYRQDAPELVLTLRRSGGGPVTWSWSKPEKGEELVLKSSAHPWYFGVASWAGKPLLEAAARDALIESAEPPTEVSENETDSGGEAESSADTTAESTPTSR